MADEQLTRVVICRKCKARNYNGSVKCRKCGSPYMRPKRKEKPAKIDKSRTANVVNLADARAAKNAAAQYEKERARREKEEEKKEAAQAKERERRDAEMKKARATLDAAEKRHDETMAAIARERDALTRREEAEEARWEKEKKKLRSLRDQI